MRRAVFLAPFVFAACSNSGTLDTSDTADTSDTGEDPGSEFAMRVDGATLAEDGDGFDLDEHATTSTSDPVGCGKVDGSGGIDNELSGLQGTMSTFGFDLDAAFADAIAGGDLVIDITVSGYHGSDDDVVLVDVTSNGEQVATNVQGSVADDVLTASLDLLPLSGEISGATFEVTARDVELSLPLSGAPASVSVSNGMLGGGLLWDESGDNDLRALVLANVPSSLAGIAESYAEGALDLQAAGTGDCDAISAALILDASPL